MWLEFVVGMADAIAWPAAVLAAVLILRHQLRALLSSASGRVKFGSIEAAWERSAERVEQAVSTVPVGEVPKRRPVDSPPPSNWHAIARAYDAVVGELANLLAASGAEDVDIEVGAFALAQWAYRAGLIERQSVDAVEGITHLRDLAAAAPDRVAPQRAAEFLTLVQAILYSIRNARRE